MDKYLIVSDIDGTLTKQQHVVSSATKSAIDRIVAAGHDFYVATGRMYALATPVASQLTPAANIIAANGAVYDFSGQRTHHTLGAAALMAVEAVTADTDFTPLYFSDDRVFYVEPIAPEIVQTAEKFATRLSDVVVVGVPDAAALLAYADEINNGIVFAVTPDAKIDVLRTQLDATQTMHLSASDPSNIELIPQHVDKANAIHELQAKTKIPPERTIVFGDGLNDLGMLKSAGVSVAMANAVPEVKAISRYETASNEEDGVAQFLNDFFMTR